MLRYLGMGRRPFGLQPMYVHRRANWEFFAVLQGRCGVVIPGQSRPALHTRHLWVFPPETAHGWRGEGAQPCRVVVFHFGRVPDLLEKAVRAGACPGCPLTAAQARWLAQLARELEPHYMRTTQKSFLVFERALLELSLLALGPVPAERAEDKNDFALRKVEAGLTWYSEHMAEQPKLEQVAQAINVSARHLRRLFQEARRESPQEGFTKMRVHRAMELLSQSGVKLEEIAAKSGFSSDSDFCRVFKARQKISPDAWRKKRLRAYKSPL